MLTRRNIFTCFLLLLLAGTFFAQTESDTLFVPAVDDDGDYIVNSLIEYIVGDTSSAGEQLHSVYKLERGQFYLLDQALDIKNPLEIYAEPPVDGDETKIPPRILSNITGEGGTATGTLISTWADITVKNIWLGGIDLGGQNRGWDEGQALNVQDSNVTVRMDGVWVDYNGWSVFATSQPHTKWFVNNLHARNEQNTGDVWTTFLFYMENAGVLDTLVLTNSTYFQANGFVIHSPATINYFEIDHCTFVNTLKWPFHHTKWLNAKFTNNIFYNVGAMSLTAEEQLTQDPDGLPYSLINVDTLNANEANDTTGIAGIPENQRTIIVKNNLYYFSDGVQQYWADNSAVSDQLWMNSRTEAMFNNDAVWPGLEAENNWNVDPLFNDFSALSEPVAKLVATCVNYRAGSYAEWDWDSDQASDQTYYKILVGTFPLAENFKSYTDLEGTDGLPLGDLNYYGIDTDVKLEDSGIPTQFELSQNYPNPFNPSTTIKFSVPEANNVILKVYNILGQEVKTLVNQQMAAGAYTVNFDASHLASGMYIYSLQSGSFSVTKKMMLLK